MLNPHSSAYDAAIRLRSTLDFTRIFDTYDGLTTYVSSFARDNNFWIRQRGRGNPRERDHRGAFECWCRNEPEDLGERGVEIVNRADARTPRTPKISNKGQQNIACKWCVGFAIKNKDLTYHFTKLRILEHTGHDPLTEEVNIDSIHSERNIPPEVYAKVTSLLTNGISEERKIKSCIEEDFDIRIDPDTFHNVLNRQRNIAQVPGMNREMKDFFVWAHEQMQTEYAHVGIMLGEHNVAERLFFMSQDMKQNFRRNAQVIVMDTTMKTNRFGIPLCILCGIDGNHHVVLFAVALIAHQSADFFAWVFRQLRNAVGNDAMNNVRCIMTDGCKGMSGAMRMELADKKRLRCIKHIEFNLNSALEGLLNTADAMENHRREGGRDAGIKTPLQLFIKQWKNVIEAETEEIFIARRDLLHGAYPCAVPYLTNNIWLNKETFVLCYLGDHVTLGIRSTQAVESQNANLKGNMNMSSTTAVTEVFKRLKNAATAVDRRNVDALEKLRNEAQLPANTTNVRTQLRAIFTLYATNVIIDEYLRVPSYTLESIPNTNEWKVSGTLTAELTRVQVDVSSMKCSCHTPTMTLLPCRHVLKVNEHVFKKPVQFNQIGNRWRLDYMPSLRLVEAALLRRPAVPFHVAYPTVYFIQQPRSQTIRDRNEVLDALFDEFRAHVINSEQSYLSGRNQLFILLEHWRQKGDADHRDSATTDAEAEPSSTSNQPIAMIGGVSADQVRDPTVVRSRGRQSRKRTRNRGEQPSTSS